MSESHRRWTIVIDREPQKVLRRRRYPGRRALVGAVRICYNYDYTVAIGLERAATCDMAEFLCHVTWQGADK